MKKRKVTYVIAKDGTPLMPTENCAKVRILLKKGKAKVIRREPFTIQLLYETTKYTQPLTLGLDPGYQNIGISVSTKQKEVYCSETETRVDIKERLAERKQYRRSRRTRKLRHRKPRFLNRKKTKAKGWLPPTMQQKMGSHLNEVSFVLGILPVSAINIEVGRFDIQKINNPEIEGTGYQEGPLKGYSSHLREYVLARDGNECQNCHGKSGDKILEVHHRQRRPKGTDREDNLITLCRTCHRKVHEGKIELKGEPPRRNIPETQMNIMRTRLVDEIRQIFDGEVGITYGADTKSKRIEMGYGKSHAIDALMISGNTKATPMDVVYKRTKHRAHNRQIHRAKFIKGHVRRRAQTDYEMFGFRLNDRVLYDGKEVFIAARRKSGYFKVASADRDFVKDGISYKKLKLLETAKNTTTITNERIVRPNV